MKEFWNGFFKQCNDWEDVQCTCFVGIFYSDLNGESVKVLDFFYQCPDWKYFLQCTDWEVVKVVECFLQCTDLKDVQVLEVFFYSALT